MPQLGDLPVLPMSLLRCDRIGEIVLRLLDEMLVHLLWANRTESLCAGRTDVHFIAGPPELAMFGVWGDMHQASNRGVVFLGERPPREKFHMLQTIVPHARIEGLG